MIPVELIRYPLIVKFKNKFCHTLFKKQKRTLHSIERFFVRSNI